MLKKLFRLLALLAAFSLTCFVIILLLDNESNLEIFKRPYPKENDTIPQVIKESIQQHLELITMDPNISLETALSTVASSKALERCPETPPDLKGSLAVEFNFKRTLDEVREKVGGPLQNGGRYKPLDCIARQKVAIIIPFRNRHEHLKQWLFFLHPILIRQQLDYGVYVINQDGEGVFNRAKLMNVGYVEALKEYDYTCFVFSDVDLVPMDDRNLYRCAEAPRHLAVAMDKFRFRLPYRGYFGGVSALSKEQYQRINGFPNSYWGWGGEDDDIYRRIQFRGMFVSRPDFVTGKYRMIRHARDLHNEPNPRNPGKLRLTKRTMSRDGMNNLKYTVKKVEMDKMFTFITVDIEAPIK